MSNMNDYMMWLDNKGYALWDDVLGELVNTGDWDLYCDEMVDDYKTDKEWHQPEVDEDDYIIEDEDEDLLNDEELGDSIAWTPQEYWFKPEGGLTGEAYNFLYTLDSQGELV